MRRSPSIASSLPDVVDVYLVLDDFGARPGKAVPAGAEWFHEVKYDGYRLRVERDGARVRLITRGGYDWTRRYPWIAEAAMKNRAKQFGIDGEAVLLGVN